MTVEELQREIAVAQPDLTVSRRSGGFEVRGLFRLVHLGTLLEEYLVELHVPDKFPDEMPKAWEIDGHIPRVADRHVNPADGSLCCFTIEDYLMWRLADGSLLGYLEVPLRNYFLSQVSYLDKGEWPFGERPHGYVGRLDFYRELFGLPVFAPKLLENLSKLRQRRFKGHHPCPCGSGDFVRRCHPKVMIVQRCFPDSMLQASAGIVEKLVEMAKHQDLIRRVVKRIMGSQAFKSETHPLSGVPLFPIFSSDRVPSVETVKVA